MCYKECLFLLICMKSNMYKIVFIFNSTNTKQLEEDTNRVKMIIKRNSEVVTGPVCFKHQRQLTAYIKFNSTIERLMEFKNHKSVNVHILTKS
jgi:ribosomal protein S10